ncbi:MAG: hypothetical protein ACLGI8_10575 [Acidimicrobiia bacterium]
MHPIERLRYVARASGADQPLLVRETAHALAAFRDDPAGLVAACRRVIERHPTSGPLWWLCARVLTSPDGQREAWAAADEIEDDPTGRLVAHALADDGTVCVVGWPEVVTEALVRRGDVAVLAVDSAGEASGLVRRLAHAGLDAEDVPSAGLAAAVADADLVLLEAVAMGPDGFVAVSGSMAAAAVARHLRVPVWAIAGAGRRLPERMWAAVRSRLEGAAVEPWLRDEEVVPLGLVDEVWGPSGARTPEESVVDTDCPVAPELTGGGSAPGTFRG